MCSQDGKSSLGIKSNGVGGDTGIYFSDIPQSDQEGSGAGNDDDADDLDENASGKGFDDEDSKSSIDKGSGEEPNGSDNDGLDLGSGGFIH